VIGIDDELPDFHLFRFKLALREFSRKALEDLLERKRKSIAMKETLFTLMNEYI
jgi:hypothetical protein